MARVVKTPKPTFINISSEIPELTPPPGLPPALLFLAGPTSDFQTAKVPLKMKLSDYLIKSPLGITSVIKTGLVTRKIVEKGKSLSIRAWFETNRGSNLPKKEEKSPHVVGRWPKRLLSAALGRNFLVRTITKFTTRILS